MIPLREQKASMSEMSCSMGGIMGYKYPTLQGYTYAIPRPSRAGYICPMEMSFIEALKHAMRVTGRGASLRDVATRAGISYDIIKNANQGKSFRPNAESATKVADFFRVSLSDFYAGNVVPLADDDDEEVAEDVLTVSQSVRRLRKENREKVKAFAEALHQTEEVDRQAE